MKRINCMLLTNHLNAAVNEVSVRDKNENIHLGYWCTLAEAVIQVMIFAEKYSTWKISSLGSEFIEPLKSWI